MALKVIWSPEALEDIDSIAEYIARDSINYAKSVAQKLFHSNELIRDNPRIGRVVPELTDENIREIFIYSYRLIYRIENNQIHIGAIVHGHRKLINALQDRSLGK